MFLPSTLSIWSSLWLTLISIYLIYRYPEVWYNRHVAAFFETYVLKEVRFLCLLSPQ